MRDYDWSADSDDLLSKKLTKYSTRYIDLVCVLPLVIYWMGAFLLSRCVNMVVLLFFHDADT